MDPRLLLICIAVIGACSSEERVEVKDNVHSSVAINIGWVEHVEGDFSFVKEWSYAHNVFENEFGELVCDNDCPERLYAMRDPDGRVLRDSIEAYYALFDTSHHFHTLASEAFAYEWSGSDFATAMRMSPRAIEVFTHMHVSTHSSLVLRVTDSTCVPVIELNSTMKPPGERVYSCSRGWVKMEREAWENGMVKAQFDLVFNNPDSPEEPLSWKGRILTPILDSAMVPLSLRFNRFRPMSWE